MAKTRMPTPEEITGMFQTSGLKEKLIFTFLIIAVFRIGAQIPIFGVDSEVFRNLAAGNNIIGFLDMFSGGALGKVSIFALGIGPYITASIIMQLLSAVVPHLEKLQKEEGEVGRRKISQYTRIFTVVLSIFQSTILVTYLTRLPGVLLPEANSALLYVGSIIVLSSGSVFIMWLAELITEKGLGNGASLLIFVSILSKIPFYFDKTAALVAADTAKQVSLVILLAIFIVTIFMIVVMQEAIRKVIIINARKQVGNKVYGGVNTHIPFKLNPGGVMPIIFAVAILLFPTTLLQVVGQSNIPSGMLTDIITFLNVNVLNPSKRIFFIIIRSLYKF